MPKNQHPIRKTWTWPDILLELKARGATLKDLADEVGVSRQAFAKVKKVASRRAQAAIALRLGLPPQEIWPDRYSIAEKPLRRRAA